MKIQHPERLFLHSEALFIIGHWCLKQKLFQACSCKNHLSFNSTWEPGCFSSSKFFVCCLIFLSAFFRSSRSLEYSTIGICYRKHLHALTLNLSGRDLISFTLIERPISVAMLQCGMVGVNSTETVLSVSLTCYETHFPCEDRLAE